jgi:hypothetical protein
MEVEQGNLGGFSCWMRKIVGDYREHSYQIYNILALKGNGGFFV